MTRLVGNPSLYPAVTAAWGSARVVVCKAASVEISSKKYGAPISV